MVKHRLTQKRYVCKSLSYFSPETEAVIMNEIEVTSKLVSLKLLFKDHPNIPKLYEVFVHENTAHLIKPFCSGGYLKDFLEKKKEISEAETLSLTMQLLSVVDYLHSKTIVHRDISSNAILVDFSKESGISYVQLMSFDNALQLQHKKQLIDRRVSNHLAFISPEQFRGRYDRKCDEYAVGVLMYFMLSGHRFPFQIKKRKNDQAFYESLVAQKLDFSDPVWATYKYQDQILYIIKGLLQKEPKLRLSAKKAL